LAINGTAKVAPCTQTSIFHDHGNDRKAISMG
jgi:hypothetical protein